MAAVEYVAVQVQIVGNAHTWQHDYASDLVRKSTRRAAIAHGIRTLGHDDFLLAHLRGDRLVMVSWQYEDRPDEADERAEMAAAFGWLDGAS